MSCQEFQTFVKKEFAFLFEEYGFSIIHLEEAKTRSNHCLIGLGASICQIQIFRTWEGANIWISQRGVLFGWAVVPVENGPCWYPIEAMVAFLLHRKRRSLEWWWSHSIEQVLSTLAKEMKVLMPQILSICADPMLLGKLDTFIQESKIE